MEESVATRYRCDACGNLTRFDVLTTRRTSSFHHYSVGGELTIEEEQLLEETVERVTCRWCGASGESIEELDESGSQAADAVAPAEPA
jgi:transposase